MPQHQQTCCIALTIYRPPTTTEWLSIRCLRSVLGDFNGYLVKPRGLDFSLPWMTDAELPEKHFASKKTYGLLLASPEFYRIFASFEWALIYQPDCLVFRNNLLEWCEQPFDYISSTCLSEYNWFATADFVGFGGLSLRRVRKFSQITESLASSTASWSSHCSDMLTYGAEDVWWNLSARKYDESFRVASVNISLAFSFNGDPNPYMQRLKSPAPPFGCHDFLSLGRFLFYWKFLPWPLPLRVLLTFPAMIELLLKSVTHIIGTVFRKFTNIAKPRVI